MWGSALRAAGIRDFRFHDTRHTFASRLARAGVPLKTIQELLGHASLKMTMRYAHLAPSDLRKGVLAISKKARETKGKGRRTPGADA
jgi:integrase